MIHSSSMSSSHSCAQSMAGNRSSTRLLAGWRWFGLVDDDEVHVAAGGDVVGEVLVPVVGCADDGVNACGAQLPGDGAGVGAAGFVVVGHDDGTAGAFELRGVVGAP